MDGFFSFVFAVAAVGVIFAWLSAYVHEKLKETEDE